MVKYWLACFCLVVSAAPCAAKDDSKPNIVLIVSDYMGYHDTEPYGATDVRTPSLARLATEGVTMTDFYAAAPVCGPSRAALYVNLHSNLTHHLHREMYRQKRRKRSCSK